MAIKVGINGFGRIGRAVIRTWLGDKDIDPNHASLPRDPEAMAQGPHRFARGTAFFDALDAAAKRRPFRFAWRKVIVPGVAHDNAGMAVAAAEVLYGSKKG